MTARRTVAIAWKPATPKEWHTFSASREECGRLWNAMVVRHARLRTLAFKYEWKWPSRERWRVWARDKFHARAMSAASVQQTVADFCDAVSATVAARRMSMTDGATHEAAADRYRYPRKTPKYRNVVYTNQSVFVSGGALLFSNGGRSA